MDKKEQLLVIEPQNELKFRGPFSTSQTSYMRLTNPTDKTILFKIKTTAPKKYCVRPNCGHLYPNDTTEIAICLQPFIYDPNEKNKHKFMVQSLAVPDGTELQFDKLWKDVSPDQLMDSKLRCVFEMPDNKVVKTTVSQTNQATNESMSDSIMSGASDEKIGDANVDMVRIASEMRQLREDESKLRQENIQLMEQNLRLKMALEKSSQQEPAAHKNPYSPPQLNQQQLPMHYIAIAVGFAVFAFILGKFVL